jgi:hypothetical protein
MKRYSKTFVLGLCALAVVVAYVTPASAQCSTCATPVVAYSPVVAPATTITYEPVRGWYPGKLLDTWRMRRYGYTAPTAITTAYAPYTVGYAPYSAGYAYSASYAPAYTTSYAPTYTTAYAPAPYSVSYAPAAYTTSYSTPYVTSYAPLQRQVVMSPVVVDSPAIATGCSTCAVEAPCSACTSCAPAAPCSSCAATTVVEQATYGAPAAAPCTNCAQGSSITYADPSMGTGASTSSQTPQPQLTPQEAAPLRSNYPDVTPPATTTPDPGPAAEQKPSDSSTYFEPPALFIPGDRTAQQESAKPINRAPSVEVWNAVYRQPVNTDNVSTSNKVAHSQAEIDAAGWSSVPAN